MKEIFVACVLYCNLFISSDIFIPNERRPSINYIGEIEKERLCKMGLVYKKPYGAPVEKDPNDPKYTQMAQESLMKYLGDIGSYRYHQVYQVLRVTEQIVSGTITRINFYAAPTNCVLDLNMNPVNPPCLISDFSSILVCNTEIWEQSWLNKKEVKVSCSPS